MKKAHAMWVDLEDLETLQHVLKAFPGDGTYRTKRAVELLKTVELTLFALSHCDSPKKTTREF